ncbi:globin domain-containing protein [Streptomyces sp. NPDC048639]|uniref:globin domain-containing protein n=1 Tax=Streptomyces sp. NPDC048639 TaxID=3365581 RepID=UPI00370FC070
MIKLRGSGALREWGWFAPPARRSPRHRRAQSASPHRERISDLAPDRNGGPASAGAPQISHVASPLPDFVPQPRTNEGSRPARSAQNPPPADAGRDPTEAPGPGTPAPLPVDTGSSPEAAAAPAESTSGAGSASPSPDAILIRRTLAEIGPVADKVISYFYAMLFVRHPDVRVLFPAAMDTQRDRLLHALLTAAEHVDDADTLTEYLVGLGRGHRKYGTVSDHYPAVGESLLLALERYATKSWDAETEAAWVRAYTAMSQIMIDAAAEDEVKAPAWWEAEVVSHEQRTSDIAVITVRPSRPYPFRAGQYTMLETPWWPRVWRHYSFASAPRPDGLLSFQIKALPAGWVSNALVHRARPGDVIRLGPPAGSMTVDHATDNGLLCLGGGTGIAPIKALVEDIVEHGCKRAVDVFYGARSGHELHDMDTWLRLEHAHPWLRVRTVVAEGPTPSGALRGLLPEAVGRFGLWDTCDVYLAGPPGLVSNGVDTLVGLGTPPHRIRHDSIAELHASVHGQGT